MILTSNEPTYSARLQEFDYSQPGAYFITICTRDRFPWFGKVTANGIDLSMAGNAALAAWHSIPDHFLNVKVDEFCIMPDHIHGLLEIHPPSIGACVGTQNFASLQTQGNRFGPQSHNLASIVRGFKVGVTKAVRNHDPAFAWQARYWDRVVRNTEEQERIRSYIRANTQRWWLRQGKS